MPVQMSPQNVMRILLERKRAFLTISGTIVFAALVYLLTATKLYESYAAVLVQIGGQDIASPVVEGTAPAAQTGSDLAKAIVNSQISVVESVDVVRAVIEKVGLARLYPKILAAADTPEEAMNDAIDRFVNKDLDVRVAKESTVLKLALLNPEPDLAQEAMDALLDAFMHQQAAATRQPRLNFLNEQLDNLGKQVDEAQNAMLEYRRKTAIGSLDLERQLMLKQRDDIEHSISESLASATGARAREAALAAALAKTPDTIQLADENDATLRDRGDAVARLAVAEARYKVAQQTYTPGNVLLSDTKAQLDLARADYARAAGGSSARVRTGVNTVYQTLQTALQSAQAEASAAEAALAQWRTQLAQINQRADHLNEIEGDMLKLQRRLDVATQDYTTYLGRAEAARISNDLNNAQITSLAVIQKATLPLKPARPKKKLILAIAIVAGALAGAAWCFLLELLDDRISLSPSFDEVMGIPVLATLPYAKRSVARLR